MNKSLVFAAGLALLSAPAFAQESPRLAAALAHASASYEPAIDPADFTHVITNKYYTLKSGMKATYKKRTPKGTTRIEIEVTGETKKVLGVTTIVVRGRQWLNGELTEETREWVAQDKDGNVWYFGEAVDNYQNGRLVNHEGSWEAGVDGAKPGIVMLNNPRAGDTYRQEYYPGTAEDMGTVVSVGKRVTVPRGASFEDCVKIRDWSRITGEAEHKYYCVGAGLMVLEEKGAERLELVGFRKESHRRPDADGGCAVCTQRRAHSIIGAVPNTGALRHARLGMEDATAAPACCAGFLSCSKIKRSCAYVS